MHLIKGYCAEAVWFSLAAPRKKVFFFFLLIVFILFLNPHMFNFIDIIFSLPQTTKLYSLKIWKML